MTLTIKNNRIGILKNEPGNRIILTQPNHTQNDIIKSKIESLKNKLKENREEMSKYSKLV